MSDFLGALLPFATLAPVTVVPAILVFTRLSAWIVLLPGIGMRIIPIRVRLMAALALTLLALPTVSMTVPETFPAFVVTLVEELIVGFYMGFLLRISIFTLSMVGAIIAQSLSLSQIFGAGISEDSNTTVSTLLTTAGAAIFLTLDFEVLAFGSVVRSFDVFPVGVLMVRDLSAMAEMALRECGAALSLSISLAGPFLILNFTYYVFLGVLNRAMPQLMVTFVGMPGITLAGLGLLGLSVGGILVLWHDSLLRIFEVALP